MKGSIKRLNKLLCSFDEWRIQSFDSCRLVLIGDFDLTYHHNVELEFVDVYYIQCPADFYPRRFRLGTIEERAQFAEAVNDATSGHLFCIEADEGKFYIIAENLVIREGVISH